MKKLDTVHSDQVLRMILDRFDAIERQMSLIESLVEHNNESIEDLNKRSYEAFTNVQTKFEQIDEALAPLFVDTEEVN